VTATPRQPPRDLYPFQGRQLRTPAGQLHYLDEGRGDPVVMVHGNPTWSFLFRDLVQALQEHHRVVVPDHMGCGLSDRPSPRRYGYRLEDRIDDLERLLAHLGVAGQEHVTLVLHDWGGMIGLGWAARHPGALRRLVLFNTAAFMLPRGVPLPWQLRLARNLGVFSTLALQGLGGFERSAVHLATARGLPPAVRAGYLSPYRTWRDRTAIARFVRDIPLTPRDRSYQLCQQVEASLERYRNLPTLICWGGRDFVFDDRFLAVWRRLLPAALVHHFPEAGHLVLEDAREAVLPLVRTFLGAHPT
jgi:pimeloyl-ACP methyl ester carboxylesterase